MNTNLESPEKCETEIVQSDGVFRSPNGMHLSSERLGRRYLKEGGYEVNW